MTIIIAVPATALLLSIVPMGDPIAGNTYDLQCSADITDGIQSTPIFSWLDSDSNRIMSGDGIAVRPPMADSLSLDFSTLTRSHAGRYTCSVTLFSLALQVPLTVTTSIYLNVQGKLSCAYDCIPEV